MLIVYGSLANSSLLVLLFLSNPRESSEFFKTFLANITLYIAAALGITGIFLFHWILTKIFRNRPLLKILVIAGVFSCFIPLSDYPSPSALVRLVRAHVEAFRELRMTHYLSLHTKPVTIPVTGTPTIPVVVVIIGESTSRHHMGVYGYNLSTTPHLSQLKADGNLSVFTDVIAPHANTEDVIKDLMTFHNSQSPNPWYNYTNLMDIINSAGYKTTWVSNQDTGGLIGSVPRIVSSVANRRIDATALKSPEKGAQIQDSLVLPFLASAVDQSEGMRFAFFHLVGTHYVYASRYPPEFAKFTAADTVGLTSQQRTVRAQYANAVLYNDHIVNTIIDAVKDQDSIVFYMSDHAEEVYDDVHRNYAGHDEFSHTHWMAEIPFMIYTSPTFTSNRPELTERIKASVNLPYVTDDFIHTLLDILGIQTTGFDPTRSVVNPSFNFRRPRVFAGAMYRL